MNAIAGHARFHQWETPAPLPRPARAVVDPLGDDRPGDAVVATTRRGLVRLALVAAETGRRFQRDGIGHDPMAWMLAPRRLFGGEAAVDAALGRDACLRAVLLHGLGLGLDADADKIDALASEDGPDGGFDDDAVAVVAEGGGSGATPPRTGGVVPFGRAADRSPRLWTATTVIEGEAGTVHAFDAAVLPSADAMLERVALRLGEDGAAATRVYEGFPEGIPLVDAMVTDAMADMLIQIAAAPASPLAQGVDVVLEQRFRA